MQGEAVVSEIGGADGAAAPAAPELVLVVDDDAIVGRVVREMLVRAGFDATVVQTGDAAIEALRTHSYDVVLSDISMPGMTGVQLLDAVRAHDLDVPVILMTGYPKLETAIEACAHGALRYLTKPVTKEVLVEAVQSASKLHRLARVRREALQLLGAANAQAIDRAGLNAGLERALASMWIAFQPIVEPGRERIFAYEALLRSNEPSLPNPAAVLGAAERLGRLEDLGRRVRALSVAAFEAASDGALLFLNLHPRDLLDPELYDAAAPLTRIAGRVVLEITERAALDDVVDLGTRVDALRGLGFRIAVDDLGAGYAGLSSFVALRPEIVKLDMSLVRNVHQSDVRRRLVAGMTSVAKELGMRVIAEGIETMQERDVLHLCGCDLMQGYLFAKPGPPFPLVDRSTMAALGSSGPGGAFGVGVGSTIDGRYELVRDLGQGAAGVVFEARHAFTGRSVAIKLVGPEVPISQLPKQRARLVREARALAAVRHPGVVEILDGGTLQDGTPFIVMEKLTGRTLEALITLRTHLSTEETVAIGLQLCEAVAAAHRASVVHRDLKPGNVLVARDARGDERIAVVDFGIAQVQVPGTEKLTEQGSILGTPAYMAPEQLQGRDDVDHRADLYAIGVILFECLTGEVPFVGSYYQLLMMSVQEGRTVAIPPTVHPWLGTIIQRALAVSPADRFADAREMASSLRAAFPTIPTRTHLLDGAASATAEQRKQRREAYATPVRITCADGLVVDGRSEDVAEGGMLVIGASTCPVGQRVGVRFAAPIDGRIVSCDAEVRWVRCARPGVASGPHAIGLAFVDPPPGLVATIAAYVELMGGG